MSVELLPDPQALVLQQPTELSVVEAGEQRLEFRTKVASYWMGTIGVVAFAAWTGHALVNAAVQVFHGEIRNGVVTVLMSSFGSAFIALFAYGATHERLVVTARNIEVQLRLGPLVLWRTRVPYRGLHRLECIYVDAGDDGGSYQLEIRHGKRRRCFGMESTPENLRELAKRIRQFQARQGVR